MKKVSIAFGGGAVLGAAHVGVLRAILERGIEIKAVAGTSIGSMVAALYAFGLDPEKVEQLAIEMSWRDITGFSLSKYGLLSNEKLGNWVGKQIGDVQIEDASIPLHIVATDLIKGEKVVFTQGSLTKAIQASTCIPGIFTPVEWQDQMLVDGGIVENVPVSPLQKEGKYPIIAIDLNVHHPEAKPANIIDVLLYSFHYTLASREALHAAQADLLIAPDLSSFNRYDTKQSKELIKVGYEAALKALDGF